MVLFLLAVLGGALTVASPCAVTLLPGVVAPSLVDDQRRPSRYAMPLVIALSLGTSVVLATITLKWLTTFTDVDPVVWQVASGGLVVLLGLSMLWPGLWDRVSGASGLTGAAHGGLARAQRAPTVVRWVLIGAALGPVFASCSPVYAFVLASVLPVDGRTGLVLVLGYGLGLALALFVMAVAGRAAVRRLGWAVRPDGLFRRVVAVGMVLTGIVVAAGWQRGFEDTVGRWLPGVTAVEERLLGAALAPPGAAPAAAPVVARLSEAPRTAPAFVGLEHPINVPSGPDLQQLRGKVVLVDFWTFGCYNCRNTQPQLNAWYDRFHDLGLEIVGVHAPEFAYERVPANVADAVREAEIAYPVALDNEFATWRAYGVHAWPTMVFIDRAGLIRHVHVGEGDYENSAAVIAALLAE